MAWEKVDAQKIIIIKTGKYDVNHNDPEGMYPFYTCAMTPFKSKTYSFDGDLILLPGNGANVGEVLFHSGKIEAYQRTYVLKVTGALPKFVFHVFKKYWKQHVSGNQFGSATNYIRYDNIAKFQLPLPPLPIQKKIAEVLDKADELRQIKKKQIEKLDKLVQSIFLDMFGDPVTNPKGWEVKRFGSIFNSIRYGTGSPPNFSKEGIPFIRATNIKEGKIKKKGLVYISSEEAREIEKCKVSTGDLIIVRSGVNAGDCGIVNKEYEFAFAGYDLIIEISEPYSTFYNHLINSSFGKAYIKPLSRRAGQPHLNAQQITDLVFYYPPTIMQQQFSDTVHAINTIREAKMQELSKLDNLFNSLMQRAFKGELQFRE